MRRLLVYLADEPVGNLEQDDSGLLEFRYRQDWFDRGLRGEARGHVSGIY